MNRQFVMLAAKLAARAAIAISIPATVMALMNGHQRPSNAAIIVASTTAAVPLITDENIIERKLRAAATSSDDASGLDNPKTDLALDGECELVKGVLIQTESQQSCYLKIRQI